MFNHSHHKAQHNSGKDLLHQSLHHPSPHGHILPRRQYNNNLGRQGLPAANTPSGILALPQCQASRQPRNRNVRIHPRMTRPSRSYHQSRIKPRNREKFGIGKRPEPMSFIEYFAAKQLPLAMATHLDIQAWFDKEAQAFRKKPEFNFPQPQKDWIRCAWDLLLASPTRFGNYRQLRRAANLEAIALYDCPWCADMNPEDQERIQTPLARRIWDARLVFDDTLIDVGVISGPWPISKEEEAKMRKRREEDAERRRRHESRVGDN
ncbi:hypothetical protein C8R46DRAFT_1067748 [Mycena filopes]|nr:hypothetical protein C8R46DRAFT_1067748 [Mycena filopes]